MKNLISSKNLLGLLLGLLALLLMNAASAQAASVRAQIPFPFLVGNDVLPAGQYTIHVNQAERRLTLHSRDQVVVIFLLTTPRLRSDAQAANGRLVFYDYGKAKALRTVWLAGTALGTELPVYKTEREIAKAAGARPAVVALTVPE